MEGAPKRQVNPQVNPEEMLAELKRVLESSTRAPNAPPPSASTAAKSSSAGREIGRSQLDKGSHRPAKANADKSIGPRTDLQKSTRPSSRRRRLIAGGLALAGAATIGVSFALMNKAPDLPTHELPVAATEGLVRSQNEQTLKPSNDSRSLMEDSQQAAPLQAGNFETRPNAGTAPANSGSVPIGGKAEVDAPHLASFGLDSATSAFTPAPLNQPAALVPTQRIGPDGAPIATTPSTPASTDSAHPPETPSSAAVPVASKVIGLDGTPIATAPSTPASTDSAPPPAGTPKPAPSSAAPQMIKPDRAPIATAPPPPASTDSAPPAETPKPNAMPTTHVSNESARPLTPKTDSKKKPPGKTSVQKPAKSAKASARPVAQAQRQSAEPPARPKEAERSPQLTQDTGNPAAVATVASPTVQQRFADGMTHAFGYLMHLPGALVPHLGGPNPDAH